MSQPYVIERVDKAFLGGMREVMSTRTTTKPLQRSIQFPLDLGETDGKREAPRRKFRHRNQPPVPPNVIV